MTRKRVSQERQSGKFEYRSVFLQEAYFLIHFFILPLKQFGGNYGFLAQRIFEEKKTSAAGVSTGVIFHIRPPHRDLAGHSFKSSVRTGQ